MQMKVRLFDRLREISGKSSLTEDMQENSTLRELIQRIAVEEGADFRKLLLDPISNKPLPNLSILVNGRHNRFLGGVKTKLREGDIVDIVTAMSGGQPRFLLDTNSNVQNV